MSELTQELMDLAGQWIVNPTGVPIPATSTVQVLQANPFRWAVLVSVTAAGGGGNLQVTFAWGINAGATAGHVIAAALQPWFMDYRAWGGILTGPLSIFNSNATAGTCHITELSLQQ